MINLEERLYIGEAVTSTLFGIIIGPYVGNVFTPRTWGSSHGTNAEEEITNEIILEVTRVVLALGVFAIGNDHYLLLFKSRLIYIL